jgi:hypothetical protein
MESSEMQNDFRRPGSGVKVIIDNELHLVGLDGPAAAALRDRLTFINPQFEENERRGFSNWQTPHELCFLEKRGHVLTMPRGFARQAWGILRYHGVPYRLEDRRRTLPPVDFTFQGGLRDFQGEERRAASRGGRVQVLVATGQLIGEGFDCQALFTLFLATPIRFDGRLLQYLGRVLRPAPGKDKARVYDYLDPVGVLEAAAKARARVYQTGTEVE